MKAWRLLDFWGIRELTYGSVGLRQVGTGEGGFEMAVFLEIASSWYLNAVVKTISILSLLHPIGRSL